MPEPDKLYSDPDDHDVKDEVVGVAPNLSAAPAEDLLSAEVQCKEGACKQRQAVAEDLDITKMGYADFIKVPRDQRLKLISDCQGVPTEGQVITFKFKRNKELIDTVRLADMPYSLRVVESGGKLYTRKAGGSFYGSDGYLFIGENTKVVVKKIDLNYSAENLKQEYSFGELKGDAEVTKFALELGIDANLLEIFLKIGKNIGLQGDETQSFLSRHGGFIQRKLMAYGPKAIKDGKYSREFVKYVLAADFPGLRDRNKYVDMYFGSAPVPAPAAVAPAKEKWVPELLPPGELSVVRDATKPSRLAAPLLPRAAEKPGEIYEDGFRVSVYPPDRAILDKYLHDMKANEALYMVDGKKFMKKTAAIMFKYAEKLAAEHGLRIGVTSGYRTCDEQHDLWEKSDKTGRTVAMNGEHQSAAAGDLVLMDLRDPNHPVQLTPLSMAEMKNFRKYKKANRDLLEQIMNRAGFVRLSNESWHFELGSPAWFEIMKKRGVLPSDADKKQYVYQKDQPGKRSRHLKVHERVGENPELIAGTEQPELMARPGLDNEHGHEDGHKHDHVPEHGSRAEAEVHHPFSNLKEIWRDSIKDIDDRWGKRRQLFENELRSFEGQTIVKNLPGNGGRPVGILVPPGTDLTKPTEIIYHLHGMNCEKLGQHPDAGPALDIFMEAASHVTGNVVIVYPLGPEYRRKYEEKRQWFGKGSGDNPALMHAEVLSEIAKLRAESVGGVATTPVEVSKTTVKGHSAGGQAIMNMAKAGFVADRYDFEDASYGWAAPAYAAAMKNIETYNATNSTSRKLEFNVFARKGTATDADARSLTGKPGVDVKWSPNGDSHEGMVAKYFNYERPDQRQASNVNPQTERPAI